MSFTEAAEELGVTQAAVSQQVRQLEDWLGTQLFKRLPRSLALTDAGIAYLPAVRESFDRLQVGTEQVFGRLERRPVTLRATATVAAMWLAPRMVGFGQAHPDITVRITTLYAPVDFGQDGVDIELRYGPGDWPGVQAHKLADEFYFPVASPSYLATAPKVREPADLMRHRLIHVLGEREGWAAYFRNHNLADPPVAAGLQCDSQVVALGACLAGAGVMLATSPQVDAHLTDKRLVALREDRIPARHAHYLVIPLGADLSREVVTVRDWLLANRVS